MINTIEGAAGDYRAGKIDRRGFLARIAALCGSMALAHHALEANGLADTLLSPAESRALQVDSSAVTYPAADGVILSGYLSAPQGAGKFPGIVVIHENRGLNDHTRDVARRFASAGFVALAPDLLSRSGGTGSMESPDKAREAIMALSGDLALADLEAGLGYLNRHTAVSEGKLASVGFCWGGARSFLLATQSPLLKAAVVFYGSAPPKEKLQQLRSPVLGLYGETDERITSQVPEVTEVLRQAGKEFLPMIYVGAGHAFFNDTGANYHAPSAKDAWTRTLDFLRPRVG